MYQLWAGGKVRLCITAFTFVCFAVAEKRPLNHNDYDAWRQIYTPTLSRDGHFAAYALFPQEGDGELIARNLQTGKEFHAPIGQQPPPAKADPNAEEPPRAPSIRMTFTNGGKTLVFSTFASRDAVEQARKDKKPAPKGGMTVMDLATGSLQHVDGVKSFAAPELKPASMMAYLKEPTDKQKTSDLVVRSFAGGGDKTLGQATDFTLSKDGATLVYVTESGAQMYDGSASKEIAAGKAKYSKLAWDEEQKKLAFAATADRSPAQIYVWPRGSEKAAVVADANAQGLKSGFVPNDSGVLAFSRNGEALFFGVAPRRTPATPPNAADPERASFDLWHWKDDNIQPMQKVRAARRRLATYRAVFHLDRPGLVMLGTREMQDVTPTEDGRYSFWAATIANTAPGRIRRALCRSYLIDNLTGARQLVAKKHSAA